MRQHCNLLVGGPAISFSIPPFSLTLPFLLLSTRNDVKFASHTIYEVAAINYNKWLMCSMSCQECCNKCATDERRNVSNQSGENRLQGVKVRVPLLLLLPERDLEWSVSSFHGLLSLLGMNPPDYKGCCKGAGAVPMAWHPIKINNSLMLQITQIRLFGIRESSKLLFPHNEQIISRQVGEGSNWGCTRRSIRVVCVWLCQCVLQSFCRGYP